MLNWRLPKIEKVQKPHSTSHTLSKSSRRLERIKREERYKMDERWVETRLWKLVFKDWYSCLDSFFLLYSFVQWSTSIAEPGPQDHSGSESVGAVVSLKSSNVWEFQKVGFVVGRREDGPDFEIQLVFSPVGWDGHLLTTLNQQP